MFSLLSSFTLAANQGLWCDTLEWKVKYRGSLEGF